MGSSLDSSGAVAPEFWPSGLPAPMFVHTHHMQSGTIYTVMESGRIRARRQYEDPQESVEVTWNFTLDEFNTFRDFFNITLEDGSLVFTSPWEDGQTRQVAFNQPYQVSHEDNLYQVTGLLELQHPDYINDVPSGTSFDDSTRDSATSTSHNESDSLTGGGGSGSGGGSDGGGGSGGGSGGGDSSGDMPNWPPLIGSTPIEGSAVWGPIYIYETDGFGGYVAISDPGVDDLNAWMESNHPGSLAAYAEETWHEFQASGIPYNHARIIWTDVNLTGLNFEAYDVFPGMDGVYSHISGLIWGLVVEYWF